MGRGIITNDLGAGQYFVKIIKDIEKAENDKSRIESRIAALDPVEDALKIASYQKKIDELQIYIDSDEEEIPVWQADLIPDGNDNKLSVDDEVGLCIVGDDTPRSGINIRPGFIDKAVYSTARDGVLKNMALLKPFNWLLNFMLQPGVRKFSPRYRHGTVTSVNYDEDKCALTVDNAISNWRLNGGVWDLQTAEFKADVPITYLDCNADPFEVGDNILIEFVDAGPNDPLVIGFKDHPKPCPGEMVMVRLGEKAFIWDVALDSFHEDYPGIQSYITAATFLAGKTETTYENDTPGIPLALRGLPYSIMLWRLYNNSGYVNNQYDYTIKGRSEFDQGGICGDLMTWTWNDAVETIAETESGTIRTTTISISACNCILGELSPACIYSYQAFWNGFWFQIIPTSYSGFTFPHLGTVRSIYQTEHYVCPIDYDEDYYFYCTGATPFYANDPIAASNNGLRFSLNDEGTGGTLAQVFFNVYSVDDGARTVVAHAAIDTWPWKEDPEDSESADVKDPLLQERNDNFSDAVEQLVEAVYSGRSAGAGGELPGLVVCDGATYPGGCIDGFGAYPYWDWVCDPEFEVKIYKK